MKYKHFRNKFDFLVDFKNCDSELLLSVIWRQTEQSYRHYDNSYTDYGVCCKLFPQMYTDSLHQQQQPRPGKRNTGDSEKSTLVSSISFRKVHQVGKGQELDIDSWYEERPEERVGVAD